jgi:hypothetical protein
MNKTQMRFVVLLLVLVIILVPLVYYGLFYRPDPYNAQNSEVLYESPIGGEVVNLNYWYFGEVMIEDPEPGLRNYYSFEFQILDWLDCPEPLEFWQDLKPITYNAFASMNETERTTMFSSAELNIARDHSPGSPTYVIDTTGTHVWAARFVFQDDYSIAGTFKVHIKILLLQIEE